MLTPPLHVEVEKQKHFKNRGRVTPNKQASPLAAATTAKT